MTNSGRCSNCSPTRDAGRTAVTSATGHSVPPWEMSLETSPFHMQISQDLNRWCDLQHLWVQLARMHVANSGVEVYQVSIGFAMFHPFSDRTCVILHLLQPLAGVGLWWYIHAGPFLHPLAVQQFCFDQLTSEDSKILLFQLPGPFETYWDRT